MSSTGGEHFFDKGFRKAYTVVFFVDEEKRRIGLLKRAPDLDFAPNLYTGVGGKLEKGEGHYEGAMRELGEELREGVDGFDKEKIQEFGRLMVNGQDILCYFILPYGQDLLPVPEENIGDLQWVSLDDVLKMDIIPTTKVFMEEWARRGWTTIEPFTVFLEREDVNDVHSRTALVSGVSGLMDKRP